VVRLDTEAVKTAVEAPANTVTEAGILTAVLLTDSATTAPPNGAVPASVTVQLADVPEASEDGAHVREDNPAGAATGTVTMPPVAEVAMLSPASEDEAAFEI
jgi:hypothetical protein